MALFTGLCQLDHLGQWAHGRMIGIVYAFSQTISVSWFKASSSLLKSCPISLIISNNNNIYLATSCEELTHKKRLWCWEGLGAEGEGDDRGWDGWMASLTRWTWVWVNSGSWWWTARPGVLRFMGSQRVGHDWVTELNWTDTLLRNLT